MRKTWALARILLKNGTGRLAKAGSGSWRQAIVPVVLAVALLPLVFAVGRLVAAIYDALQPIGQQGVVLGLGLSLASLVVFMFGVFYVITVFYFAQDVEQLLPLPLKPAQIVTAKFLTVLIYEYLTQLVVLVPLLGVFGAKEGSGPLYYLYAVLIFLVLPVVPLVLASLLAMAVMSFAGIARNKDRFRMIGGVAAIVLSFGLNTVIQRALNRTMQPEQLQEMLTGGGNSFVELATRSFPPVRLAANALLREAEPAGLAWLVLFAALAAAVYAIFALLAQRFYFRGVMGISETSGRRMALSGSELDKRTAQQSALRSFMAKELRILLRTPPYFLNCVLMSLLWPVLMLIPILSQPGLRDMLGSARTLFASASFSAVVPAVGLAMLMFVSAANATASTAISREGAGFFVVKYVPVPYASVIAAKVVVGWIVTMFGAVLLLVVAVFVLGLPLAFALAMLLIAVLATLFTCLTGIALDLLMPKLVWDNEQKAVKQNMNGLLNLLLCLAFTALLVILVVMPGFGLWTATFVLLGALALADALLVRLLRTKGPVWFGRIEI